jgi:hypothetical protein
MVTLLGSRGSGYEELRAIETDDNGAFTLRLRHRARRRYVLRWTAADGTVYEGAPVRAY